VKHDTRQIVINVEVVIVERVVLFRVKNFEKGPTMDRHEIHTHLVNFVKHMTGLITPARFID